MGRIIVAIILLMMFAIVIISYGIFFRTAINSKSEAADHFDRINDRIQRKLALQKRIEDRAARSIQRAWSDSSIRPTSSRRGGRQTKRSPSRRASERLDTPRTTVS